MRSLISSSIMRTTIDLDAPILLELKRLQKKEGKSLGKLASELLAWALKERGRASPGTAEPEPRWIAKPLGSPRVDLLDKEAVAALLDAEKKRGREA
jgi:hypothetical protein